MRSRFHGFWQHLARSRHLQTTQVLWAISRADALTVIEGVETVLSVFSGDKDSSSERKLSASPNSPGLLFFLGLVLCDPYFSFQKQTLSTMIYTLSKNEQKLSVGS